MKIVYSNEYFAIYDDFLSNKNFEYVWTFMQEEEYHFYQVNEWKKINRLFDGNHLEGRVYMSNNGPTFKNTLSTPTNTAIDIVFDNIDSNIVEFEPWIGKKGQDWEFYTLTPFLYPQETGVSWHDDYTKSSGTCTFYCHPYWNIQWGGELIVADTSDKNVPPNFRKKYNTEKPIPIGPYLDNTRQNEQVFSPGYGHYILPKPNRLVFIKSGTLHCVKKVDKCAGDNPRASMQAFFHNPNKPEGRY